MHLIAEYLNTKRRFPEKNVLLLKPAIDDRTEGVYTRFGDMEIKLDFPIYHNANSHTVQFFMTLQNADIMFVDEAQFLPMWFLNLVVRRNSEYFFYGLRNDANKVMWQPVQWLMNYAHELVELPTVCEVCKKNRASFNKSLKAIEDAQNSPGFHFIPVCGSCY